MVLQIEMARPLHPILRTRRHYHPRRIHPRCRRIRLHDSMLSPRARLERPSTCLEAIAIGARPIQPPMEPRSSPRHLLGLTARITTCGVHVRWERLASTKHWQGHGVSHPLLALDRSGMHAHVHIPRAKEHQCDRSRPVRARDGRPVKFQGRGRRSCWPIRGRKRRRDYDWRSTGIRGGAGLVDARCYQRYGKHASGGTQDAGCRVQGEWRAWLPAERDQDCRLRSATAAPIAGYSSQLCSCYCVPDWSDHRPVWRQSRSELDLYSRRWNHDRLLDTSLV